VARALAWRGPKPLTSDVASKRRSEPVALALMEGVVNCMVDSATGASPRQLARIAGALYLINIVGGAFAIGFVRAALFTPDLATTAHNIQTHQLLYRLGLAAHLVVTLTNVPLALIFYELFKVVNRRLALLTAFFILVATAIEAAGLVYEFTPLALLGSGPFASALPPAQLEALASQALCRMAATTSTPCSSALTSSAWRTWCSSRGSCPVRSASCWRSTAWRTWSTASRIS
jgi:Domain of unknown function (DUF4386)